MLSDENKDIAFIIPVHPPKYEYIYRIRNKLIRVNSFCDIFLVFQNVDDCNKFIHIENVKCLVIPPGSQTNNIIVFKKFYALFLLGQSYSYYIVCDSEIDIIDENFTKENVLAKINQFYEKKTVYAGDVSMTCITKPCCEIFSSPDDRKILKERTLDYRLYYWWCDLPVYKASHIHDFFSKINLKSGLVRSHFDHKIYINYLVLYYGFKFLNLTPVLGKLGMYGTLEQYEDQNLDNLRVLKDLGYSFSWVYPRLFDIHKEFLTENGAFLLYHTDRV